jgi:hypothetical protein
VPEDTAASSAARTGWIENESAAATANAIKYFLFMKDPFTYHGRLARA